MNFPETPYPALVTIHPWSIDSIGVILPGLCDYISAVTRSTTVWFSANMALFVPFHVYRVTKVVKMFVCHGSVVSGNVDVGIYDPKGKRIVSSGSTAQSGTTAAVEYDITDTVLPPGLYYMALAIDNITARVISSTNVLAAVELPMAGVYEVASSFPLPASVTYATPSLTSRMPLFGVHTLTLL